MKIGPMWLAMTAVPVLAVGMTQQRPAPPVGQVAYVSSQRISNETTDGKAGVARLQAAQRDRAADVRTKQQALETTRQQMTLAADDAARVRLRTEEQRQRTELGAGGSTVTGRLADDAAAGVGGGGGEGEGRRRGGGEGHGDSSRAERRNRDRLELAWTRSDIAGRREDERAGRGAAYSVRRPAGHRVRPYGRPAAEVRTVSTFRPSSRR